jgi:hypothetical protein
MRRAAVVLSATVLAFLIGTTVPAHSQERPFEPIFEVSSALRSAGEPTQVQIYFELKEGHAFPSKAVLEIPSEYQIPRGSEVPNGDIVGDGVITIKAGALGVQTVNVCLSNQSPPRSGDWATLNVAVQLGNTQGGGCTGILNLSLGLKRQSETGPFTATLELPSGGGFGLDTPLKLTVNLFGVSRPDPQSIPPAPGGFEVLKNPATPGIYEWKLTVQDPAGRVKELSQPQRIDQPPPRPSETGKKLTRWGAILGGVLGAILLIALLVILARRRARKIYEEVAAEQAEFDGVDYYEEIDEDSVAAGDRSSGGGFV